jgi:hypothetical protein
MICSLGGVSMCVYEVITSDTRLTNSSPKPAAAIQERGMSGKEEVLLGHEYKYTSLLSLAQ